MFGKKAVFIGLLCTILALVFGGCSHSPTVVMVFDEDYPLEKSSTLLFGSGLVIKSYNGIPVQTSGDSLTGKKSEWSFVRVVLPAGEMEFGLDVYYVVTSSAGAYRTYRDVYTAEDVFFKFKFEPEIDYTLIFTRFGGIDKETWGVNIFKVNLTEKLRPLTNDDLAAFVPFYK